MVAKSLDLSNRRSANMADKRKQMDMYDFPEHDCTRNKTVAHTFIPSLDNANGRLRQERLFRCRNFATTSHFPSLFNASLYYLSAWKGRANFKVPIYPVNQSLNQPLVEPFENNLNQKQLYQISVPAYTDNHFKPFFRVRKFNAKRNLLNLHCK